MFPGLILGAGIGAEEESLATEGAYPEGPVVDFEGSRASIVVSLSFPNWKSKG